MKGAPVFLSSSCTKLDIVQTMSKNLLAYQNGFLGVPRLVGRCLSCEVINAIQIEVDNVHEDF